jgi:hypothetical protein
LMTMLSFFFLDRTNMAVSLRRSFPESGVVS